MKGSLLCAVFLLAALPAAAAPRLERAAETEPGAVVLSAARGGADIVVDPGDYAVVTLAASLFADDVRSVTGRRPRVRAEIAGRQAVIVGAIGHSTPIDRLIGAGKLPGAAAIRGRWEATLWQVVPQPFPGVESALVIAGSDRRGAAYGLMQLSETIGVSPWNWWADVPVARAASLAIRVRGAQTDAPAVRYRGMFINDEDWGLNPWAAQTFDPRFGNIGPKTYAKVFELMLRLRLNYLWPAMHACSAEFASEPENIRLADRFGIVAGSSHCEPMLCNNVHWDERRQGRWDYTVNRAAMQAYWAESARSRGQDEAVWTLGVRGIHDAPMEGPRDLQTRIGIVSDVMRDQRDLIRRYVTQGWGSVAQCFVPYKEVLPVYDAGLQVPDDVTLVWVDDNFGYIRRLSSPSERRRSGGAGVYWHLSYYGRPHSYTWIDTTPPALMWEELRKAWANEARRLWVVNVGDIKPMEIGIDYFSRLAWNPEALEADGQPGFLRAFAAENFGPALADRVARLLTEYYRLGTIRRPELMDRHWAMSLDEAEARELEAAYRRILEEQAALTREMEPSAHDAFVETIGFPARVVGLSGLIFLADRRAQLKVDAPANHAAMERSREELEDAVREFNLRLARGKWNRIMPGLVTNQPLDRWLSEVRWPWGEKPGSAVSAPAEDQPHGWRSAAAADQNISAAAARWTAVAGLGASGTAMTVVPSGVESSWAAGDRAAPTLAYRFEHRSGEAAAYFDFLPTFRLFPGMKLRVAVAIDHEAPIEVEVAGSNGREDEGGPIRSAAVQGNRVRVRVPFPNLAYGRHVLRIAAVDPGAVLDRVRLPE